MDIISFNEAATANGRIEKFIENPDSNSGIVTVPKVIGAGESVTIPAGRTAVLPNVQVDGELVVDGEVFIPSGAELSTVVQKSGDTMTGSLTTPSLISTGALYSNDGTTTTRVISSGGVSYIGTITNHPLVLQTGNTERMRIDTAGNVGIGSDTVPDAATKLFIKIDTNNHGYSHILNTGNYNSGIRLTNTVSDWYAYARINTGDLEFYRNIGTGNVLVSSPAGLGYGTGAGGTVTQLTSKSTAVTLNKPCGQITMHNASLAAGGVVYFLLNNSLLTLNDTVVATFKDGSAVDIRLYRVEAISQGTGYSWMKITNTHTAALAESPVITFAIIKGAVA